MLKIYKIIFQILIVTLFQCIAFSQEFKYSILPKQGPYLFSGVNFLHSPLSPRKVMSQLSFRAEGGWVETLSDSSKSFYSNSSIRSHARISLSPYQGKGQLGFGFYFLNSLNIDFIYFAMIPHLSLVGHDTLENFNWSPGTILNQVVEGDGNFGVAENFMMQMGLDIPVSAIRLRFLGRHEFWNINSKGKRYVYDYTLDFPLNRKDQVTTLQALMMIDLTKLFGCASLAMHWSGIKAHKADLKKSHIGLGVINIPLSKNRESGPSLEILTQTYINHPLLKGAGIADRLVLSGSILWNLEFSKWIQ